MAFGSFDSRSGPMQPMSEINTTPLVDVMLVLLVIFIITAPLLTHAIRLDLPQATSQSASAASDSVTLSIDAAGQLFWNGEALPPDALRERLQSAAALEPQPELHLRADRETRYQALADVMSAAQAAGLSRIGFVTEPRTTQALQPPRSPQSPQPFQSPPAR
jgi:biopolymer transport protein ExbD